MTEPPAADPPRRRRQKWTEDDKGGARASPERLRSAKTRTASSQRWLERQLNDPYVQRAQAAGYRSRAAYKLMELDDRFRFGFADAQVIDLGAAPGGWAQVALQRGAKALVGVDLLDIEPLAMADFIKGDFTDPDVAIKLRAALGVAPDMVLSDMAANTTGHAQTDHLRTSALLEAAAVYALENLAAGGRFCAKAFLGGAEKDVLAMLKGRFEVIRHAKPPASRKESPEIYLVALGFRGR